MNLHYRPPTAEDIAHVAATMRDEDVLEVAASHGHSPFQALVESIHQSTHSFACVVDGVAVCIFGFTCVPDSGDAAIWLLGSQDLMGLRRVFLVEARRILDAWSEQFNVMFNYVSAGSKLTRRWLRGMGFREGPEPVSYGAAGLPFYFMWRSADV